MGGTNTADHGFGGGRLTDSKLATDTDKEEIAKCISRLPEVLWCHVVLASAGVKEHYDLLWEMKKKVDDEGVKKKIRACASEHGYRITSISTIKIKDKSFKRGKPGKHPKDE